MQLFFREQGSGFPLIILHGLFGSSDNWVTVTKKLAETYKVYLLDLRNHGRSPHSEDFNYKVMSEDLSEFMVTQNIQEAYIAGHSMGGKTVMRFAIDHPEKVKKLVVIDIGPKYYRRHHDTIIEGMKSIGLETLSNRQEADERLQRSIPELSVRQFLLKNLAREEDRFTWKINLPVIEREIENVGEGLSNQTKFNKDTLFIRGGKSRYILDEDFISIKEIFPKCEIKTIASAGHWVQAEAPEEFLQILEEFLGN